MCFYLWSVFKMSVSADYFQQQYGLSATHSEVVAWLEAGYLNHGHVLDLGCGRGRNALYLAKHGFDVHACDADANSIASLNRIIAAEHMNNIETDVYDINRAVVQSTYDVVVSTVVMQFLQADRIEAIIRNMQAQTAVGGWNLIVSAVATEGVTVPDFLKFYFQPEALREYYADWDVVKYNENEGELHRTDANGNRIRLKFATLWARKRA